MNYHETCIWYDDGVYPTLKLGYEYGIVYINTMEGHRDSMRYQYSDVVFFVC